MSPITTTLREILSTGKLGHLHVGMKRELLAELIPELNPPNGKDSWRYGGIEIFFQADTVWYFKIVPAWHDFSFLPSANVVGYMPSYETTFDEFLDYLETENLSYIVAWNSFDNTRWPVIFVEDKAKIAFGEDDLRIIGIYVSNDIEHQKLLSIAEHIGLNIFDFLKPHILQGKLLTKEYQYKPASVQIFEPNDFRPDVSHLILDRLISGYVISGVPDLAVVVVKPKMDDEWLQKQILIYLSEGTKQVWLVYPTNEEVHCHTSENIQIYRESQVINTEKLFPTIESLTANTIFHLPKPNNQSPKTNH